MNEQSDGFQEDSERITCSVCEDSNKLAFDFSMAFQPIISLEQQSVFGYEALVRGLKGEPAASIISQVNDDNRYLFDQRCRVKAIALAAKLNITSVLSINFLPNAIYQPERCMRTTLEAAKKFNFPIDRIMFEFTEQEKVRDHEHIRSIVSYYQSLGLTTAIDDFGAGFSGLNLLADFQTTIVKIDMGLIRGIESDRVRQIIFSHTFDLLRALKITPLVEGVETKEEFFWLAESGIDLMQGYLFAKPAFEQLPEISIPTKS